MLDDTALARLRELDPDGSLGVVGRVLETFRTALGRDLERLALARDAGDLKTVGEVAHKVKSSSASVGALELSALCAEVERRVRAGDTADIAPRVQALLDEAQRALRAVVAALRT
ncbi:MULTISPECIES: Hpt domain-containing protein [Rubrivivax]|uniref:Hpt domain-containing protein n=1 Tax=Rubrivivax benzoatilyticus TaxID=316997 RepID=A0ABX0HXZ0_9BURK|nr:MULTISPECIES: Hpt domain-containing protein [Rubrivivax]EGJ08912.1 signal transduction histidine kinase-like protein [Rubrivivax benzoatilyticus JA2 = ATCC BAA-35]MCC9596236.1 Hpt domain-containing protein [Rubrivivax sp. JA1055]MCC9647423.1 Hpt domain-containing protein [Rubrivivax sp. JA1029]NHK99863.1 Hpt domain-containing protein [Rubrivivax benzoatilyticus]NHL25858.1 Hpt domain-containing protein [Rubrivivax benzoatilyticus]